MKKIPTLFFALFALAFIAKAQITEDFESYTAFSVDPAGTWTYFDGDSGRTYGSENYDFTNSNYVGSCIIFNPSLTSPSCVTDHPAHSGSQFLIMFNAVPNTIVHGSTTNDWLISPAISNANGSILTLYARELSVSYGAETMNILYSTTGNNPEDFTLLQTEAIASTSWTMYSYSIPANATHVAINCTSNNVFGLCIDDISIMPIPSDPTIASFPTLNFGSVRLLNNKVLTAPVQVWNLTSALTASSSDAMFELSFDGTNFASTATISNPVDSTYTLYVQYTPTTSGTATGTITLSSTGATSVDIAFTGNGIDCSDNTLPYFFAFDDVGQAFCWTTVDVDNNASGDNGAISINTAGGYAYYMYSNNAAANDWLISPTFYIPENGAIASFDYQVAGAFYPEKFSVYVIPADSTYTNAIQIVPTQTVNNTNLETQYIDLTNFAGQSIQIAIKVESDAYQYYIRFTNFFIGEELPATITPNPSQINFGEVIVGYSPNNMIILNSTSLDEDIVLTTETPYSISLNGIDYFSTITIPANSEFEVNDTIYVQYTPTDADSHNGMISISAGTIQDSIILSGTAIVCDAITTLPYVQNFDSVNTNDLLPVCWAQLSPFNTYPRVSISYARTGMALEFRANHTTTYAIMPLFDEELSNLQINFWTRRESTSSGTLSVGYITDLSDVSTFVPTWSISGAEIGNNDYHNYTVRFAAAENEPTAYIAFRYESSTWYYWYVEDITVELVPDCIEAVDLNTVSTSTTSADLTWDGGNSTLFNLHYMSLNDSIDHVVNDVQLDVDGVYTLDNLPSSTAFEWYIETVCSDSSYVSAHAFFTTAGCSAEDQCTITIVGADLFGDGWNGNAINIMQGGVIVSTFTLPVNTSTLTEAINVCADMPVSFSWVNGTVAYETSFEIYEGGNSLVYTGDGIDMVDGSTFFTLNNACPTCFPATELTVDAATENSITISWTGTAASYDIYDGVNFVDNVTDNTYTFNGLTASTGYVFGVQAICSAADSALMATINATTSCLDIAINLPFTETFEINSGTRNCWTTIDADNDGFGWTTLTNGTGADQETMLSYSYDENTDAALTPDNWLISPKLHSNAGNNITMQWTVSSYVYYPAEHYAVYVSTTIIDTNAFTMVGEWTISNSNTEIKSIDLSAYAGQDIYVAFRHFNCTDQQVLKIDNVQLYESTSVPETLTVTLAVNNATMGTVTPAGTSTVDEGTSFTATATALDGYHFVAWMNGTTQVSTANPYTFTVTGNITLTATFEANDPQVTYYNVTVNSANTTMGNVTSTHSGQVAENTVVTATATANTGYRFVNWTNAEGTEVSTNNEYTFTVTSDITLIANFEILDAINNITLANSISLMPNPADNYIDLSVSSNVNVKEAVVYNTFGQMIQTVQLNDNHARIDLSDMAAGMYFVRVNSEGVTATKKFIRK